MFKGNYSSWIISIGLHVVLIIVIAKQTLPAPNSDAATIMKAYVIVNLASLPAITPSPLTIATQEVNSKTKLTVKKDQALINSSAKDNQLSEVKQSDNQSKHSEQLAVAKPSEASLKKEPALVASPAVAFENKKAGFKKLNPYALLPKKSAGNVSNQDIVMFEHVKQQAVEEITSNDRITVPKEHLNDERAEIISTSGGGTKRVEKWRGKCYDIDLTSVFGQAGMPQGGPRLCPGEKSDNQVLFEKSMNKWSRFNQRK